MRNFDSLAENMSLSVYQKLCSAVELGKWEDGTRLTAEQKASSLQLVMLFQAKHLEGAEHMTIDNSGDIVQLSKAELKQRFNEDVIVNFKQDEL